MSVPPTAAVTPSGDGSAGDPAARLPHQADGSLLGSDGVGLRGASLTLAGSAARVTVRATDLPGLLYRITTPAGSGLAPRVTGTDGVVRLGLRPTGDDGPDTVDILLNRTVRWRIRLGAGAGEQHLDLAAGRIGRVDLGAGVGLVRVRLPRPPGVVPIRLTGSVGSAEFTVPRGAPVRIRLARGAASAVLPWGSHDGPPPGAVLVSPIRPVAGRYRIDALADVGTLIVRTG